MRLFVFWVNPRILHIILANYIERSCDDIFASVEIHLRIIPNSVIAELGSGSVAAWAGQGIADNKT